MNTGTVPGPVPLGTRHMDMVFFLYPTEEEALRGTAYGGTGFLVRCASPQSRPWRLR